MNAKNYIIHPRVNLGISVKIGEFVIIGHPPRGKEPGDLETTIGDFSTIRSHSVIYSGTVIGKNLETGHGVMIREDNIIGENVSIGTNSVIENGNEIGNNVRIHSNVFIPQYTVVKDNVIIAPNVVLTNDPHPPCGKCMKGPTIEKGVKIGANVTVLPFLRLGENSLIGAGSVVVKDVPPNSVAAGSPAKVIKSIDDLECPFGIVSKPYRE